MAVKPGDGAFEEALQRVLRDHAGLFRRLVDLDRVRLGRCSTYGREAYVLDDSDEDGTTRGPACSGHVRDPVVARVLAELDQRRAGVDGEGPPGGRIRSGKGMRPDFAKSARLLFVCSAATDRSPTAARAFAERGYDTRTRGTWPTARRRLRLEDLEWCDVALAMEEEHAAAIRKTFPGWWANGAEKVEVLGIADDYGYGDPQLVRLIDERITPILMRRGLRP